MSVTFKCENPECPRTFTVSDDLAGNKARCNICGTKNKVPTAAELAEINNFCAEFGSDVIATDEHGDTLLHKAVSHKQMSLSFWDVAVIKYLYSRGANVNATDESGMTPLCLAAMWKNADAVKLFVTIEKINVNAKSHDGFSSLHRAAHNGDVEIIKTLTEFQIKNDLKYTITALCNV